MRLLSKSGRKSGTPSAPTVPSDGADAIQAANPVLAGFATGMAWFIPAAALSSSLLFPWLWIYAIVPGPAIGLLVALYRAHRAGARAGGTGIECLYGMLAALAGIATVVVPFIWWRIVSS